MKRKSLSKKVRFEVFKRDSFTCSYCGATPPSVILEVDHIIPVSKGGENSLENLTTSCFDCNRGKSSNSLTSIPQTLAKKTEQQKELENQVLEYNKLLKNMKARKTRQINKIGKIFTGHFSDWTLNERFKKESLVRFLTSLPPVVVEDAMDLACLKMCNDPKNAIKYFCGICWKKIKGDFHE